MTRADLLIFLTQEGYNEKALRILSFEELKHIAIITIAVNWGVITPEQLKK